MIAVLSDAVSFGLVLLPPVQWAVDAITAVIHFVALGFRWALLGAIAIEAVPGLQVFPAWTLVVSTLASTKTEDVPSASKAIDSDLPLQPNE